MKVTVKTSAGKSYSVEVASNDTVHALKEKLQTEGLSAANIQLCVSGKKMEDDRQLSAYNISEKALIFAIARSADAMEISKEETPSAAPVRCLGGCGFWGNPKTENYCSKCFATKKPTSTGAPTSTAPIPMPITVTAPVVSSSAPAVASSSPVSIPGAAAPAPQKDSLLDPMDAAPGSSTSLSTSPVSGLSASPSSSPQTDATRCWECKKKVGLLGIKCRCNYIYCSKHRYSDQHNCQFDFKAREKDLLKQRLVQVAGEKITKI